MELNDRQSIFRSWHWESDSPVSQLALRHATDQALFLSQGTELWKTRHGQVRRFPLPPELGEGSFVVKRYRGDPRWWRSILRPSLVCREAQGFAILKRLGIPAVELFLCGERRTPFFVRECFIVTRFEEGLHQLLEFAPGGPMEKEHGILLDLMRQNLGYLARLHKAGYTHGGAHPRNLMWRKKTSGETEVVWLDLATLRKRQFFTWRSRRTLDLNDLIERFHFSDDELAGMAEYYTTQCGTPVSFIQKDISERKFNVALLKN